MFDQDLKNPNNDDLLAFNNSDYFCSKSINCASYYQSSLMIISTLTMVGTSGSDSMF